MDQVRQLWMRISGLFSRKGWRRAAVVNVVLACACDLTLLIFLVVSLSQPGASLAQATIIFNGSCTTSSRLNLLLHFLINAISTAVLASSNFFMQILNAPSRQEIDRAHTWLRALDIGIPSIGNLSHVSRFKSASWLVFLITSIPIHLIFNSAVFETTYEGSQWYLTLATKAFTQGAPFFPPGASLSPAGSFVTPPFVDEFESGESGYGEAVPLNQYWNTSSVVHQKIAFTAKESHSWTFLSAAQCYSEYVSCNSRKKYSDVVLIVDSTESEAGWARSDIFTFDPSTHLSTLWDTHIPPNTTNSLWFSAPCNITRSKAYKPGDYCTNTCLGAMGLNEYVFPLSKKFPMSHEPWLIGFFPAVRHYNKSLFDGGLEFNDKFDSLRVDHCLAQTFQPACKVGLSNTLLLIVILSILVKAIQGGVVAWKLSSTSLVTPGDAIESFILYPDPVTRGVGTLDIVDAHQIEFGRRRHWSNTLHLGLTTEVQPRRWKKSPRRLRHVLPYMNWVQISSIFSIGIGLLLTGFISSSLEPWNNYSDSIDHSNGVRSVELLGGSPGYLATLLFANTPQLILSICYFSYNSFLTRYNVEKDWNASSVSYKPLRVSYPTGQQISSYRLQLPYRYSVPLIAISATLHWLLSNALFLYINEGGYYWDPHGRIDGLSKAFSISDGALITVGYSSLFILLLFITSFLFILFPPIILLFFKMKGDMVPGGWNSLVISAACHVPNIEKGQAEQDPANETDNLLREGVRTGYPKDSIEQGEDEGNLDRSLHLSQRELRWGVTELPIRLVESVSGEGSTIFHLGFGGEEHNISDPEDGQYYV